MKHEWQQAEPSNKPKPLLLLNFTFFHLVGRLKWVFSLTFKFPHCLGAQCGYLTPTLTLKMRGKDKTCYEITESLQHRDRLICIYTLTALGIRARKFGFSSLSTKSCVNIDLHGTKAKSKTLCFTFLSSLIRLIMQINIDLYLRTFLYNRVLFCDNLVLAAV